MNDRIKAVVRAAERLVFRWETACDVGALIDDASSLRAAFDYLTEEDLAECAAEGGGVMRGFKLVGYFSSVGQAVPDFDPGLELPCPICWKTLEVGEIKTTSFMGEDGIRSYFYRTHKGCDSETIEADIVDEVLGR